MLQPLRILLTLMAVAQPLSAEDWEVLVIGNPSRSAPGAFADSHAAADTFRQMGLGPVTLRREIGADALGEALEGLTGAPRVVIYFAGPIGAGSSGPMLMGQGGGDPRGAIGPLLARLAGSGTRQAVLLIEDCAGGDGFAGRLQAPEIPAGMTVFMAASAGSTATCPTKPDRLTDRLALATGDSLQSRLGGLWRGADTLPPVDLTPAATPATGSAAEIAVVSGDVIQLAPVAIAATAPTEVIAGTTVDEPAESAVAVATQPPAPAAEPAVFRPLRDEDLLAIPVAAGMPQPSIIVGIIRPPEPEAPPEPEFPEIAFDDASAREALRTDNPALFQAMVDAGRLDPPPESLVTALQTELQRGGCYTSTIDGQWGNGSRRAVDRFAETAGLTAVSQEPDIALYRQILLAGAVTCPAPVVEAAPARPATPRASEPAAAPRPTPAPAPAPAPRPAAPSGGISDGALGGVFR
ncbi:MAG: peptidoglycan-binding protein [Tabrizicola sp.]|jgi:hypothetical protein|nr:peptidoglycan-binding protein [Tabrizicola sp.]